MSREERPMQLHLARSPGQFQRMLVSYEIGFRVLLVLPPEPNLQENLSRDTDAGFVDQKIYVSEGPQRYIPVGGNSHGGALHDHDANSGLIHSPSQIRYCKGSCK